MSLQADGPALPERYDVRKAQLAMAADLTGTLAGAFYDNPLFAWLLPSPSRRGAIATEPHFYLAFVGVDLHSQGHGMGSILMHPVVQRCDAEGVPAYLEASAPRNRALYEPVVGA